MKALFIFCKEFAYTPTVKTIEGASNNNTSSRHENVQVAFLQVEQEDVERDKKVEEKLVKNLKWICYIRLPICRKAKQNHNSQSYY